MKYYRLPLLAVLAASLFSVAGLAVAAVPAQSPLSDVSASAPERNDELGRKERRCSPCPTNSSEAEEVQNNCCNG